MRTNMDDTGFEFDFPLGDERDSLTYQDVEGEEITLIEDYGEHDHLGDEYEFVELRFDKDEFQGYGETEADAEKFARNLDALQESGNFEAVQWDPNYDNDGQVVVLGATKDRDALFEFTDDTDFYLNR